MTTTLASLHRINQKNAIEPGNDFLVHAHPRMLSIARPAKRLMHSRTGYASFRAILVIGTDVK